MIIVYIIGFFIVAGIALALLKLAIQGIAYLIGFSFMAIIAGLLTLWWFDSFWIGFIIGEVITIYLYWAGRNSDRGSSGYSPTNTPRLDADSYSPRRPVYTPTIYPEDNAQRRYEQERQEQEERKKRQDKYDCYMREADEAYRNYNYYKSKAEDARSSAEVYIRSAEDHERYGRDYNDESHFREARSDRATAESFYRDARQYIDQANSYYSKYESAIHKAQQL